MASRSFSPRSSRYITKTNPAFSVQNSKVLKLFVAIIPNNQYLLEVENTSRNHHIHIFPQTLMDIFPLKNHCDTQNGITEY